MGQDKAWETLTPFCDGVYVNTCPTDREGEVRGYEASRSAPSHWFSNKEEISKDQTQKHWGISSSLTLITFSYQLCLGLMCPSTVVQCSLSEGKPF